MTKSLLLISVLALLLLAGSASATNYYVSPSGSGTTCSDASPCAMNYGVNTKSQPGDTVIFKNGTYNRTNEYSPGYLLYITAGGNATHYKTIKAEYKWGAILDEENYTESNCISYAEGNYTNLEDFEIKNCSYGIMADIPHNIDMTGLWVHHIEKQGITTGGAGGDDVNIDKILLHDIYGYSTVPLQHHGIYAQGTASDNLTISNSIIYDTPYGWPIQLYDGGISYVHKNITIINNVFSDYCSSDKIGHIMIAYHATNLNISNNIFYQPPYAAIQAYRNNVGNTIIVRNNIGTNYSCYSDDGYCSQLTQTDNQFSTNPQLVDVTNRNYRLNSTSPAINNGTSIDAPLYDFDGVLRGSPPDIGAYEYVEESTSNDTYIIGAGGNAWIGNSSFSNVTLNRDTDAIFLNNINKDEISKWRFDGSGISTVAYDENLTSNNNGTLVGATWNASAKYGNALFFDGNDQVNIGNKPSLRPTNGMSIGAWVYPTVVDATLNAAFSTTNPGGDNGTLLGVDFNDKLTFFIDEDGNSDWKKAVANDVVVPNTWYYVVGTWDGSTVRIYVNGIIQTTTAVATKITYDATDVSTIGSYAGAYYWNGIVDNLVFYNYVLTNDEINLTMNNTMLTTGNLTAWWNTSTGYQIANITINATTDANSNYTVYGYNNATSAYLETLGSALTGNHTLTPTVKVQDYKLVVTLNGNSTSTPEIRTVTFAREEAGISNQFPEIDVAVTIT